MSHTCSFLSPLSLSFNVTKQLLTEWAKPQRRAQGIETSAARSKVNVPEQENSVGNKSQ